MRIDRVFTDGRLRFVKFAVFKRRGSDHFPVVADLELVGR
jgi:endonuclease/exonuclease/phosphatase family metal-dependent hydrolase